LEARTIRSERQGLVLRRDHRLASCAGVSPAEMAAETLLLHPRDANPGHYDAVLGLCREQGVEPRVLLRTLSFDLTYGPILRSEAVAVVGESSRMELPEELCWLPLSPPVSFEVSLLVRGHNRSPPVDRLLDAATGIADALGWI
jgi:DNA-binding transcriptional LysR family regulator